jgi:uncharacterized protein (DUF433 family)
VDKALRLEQDPLISFGEGAAGLRRPALVGTRLYVWQVLETLRASDDVADAASYLGLGEAQVRAAVAYYADHRGEVDERIEATQRAADEAEAAWRRQQEVLAGRGQ